MQEQIMYAVNAAGTQTILWVALLLVFSIAGLIDQLTTPSDKDK